MNVKLKYKMINKTSYVFLFVFIFEIFYPSVAMALTSGPTPPEFKSFEPATTTDMVDLFSGDMTYNLPLFELPGPNGGYPFNLAYHAGPGMEQDASWVGLGWDLNAGAINRNMRGLPDEFNGDEIKKTEHTKPNVTAGVDFGGNFEIIGVDLGPLGLSASASCFYNSYKGMGYSIGFGASFKGGVDEGVGGGLGLNITMNSQEGVDLSPSISLSSSTKVSGKDDVFGTTSASLGASFNSMQGYKGMSFGISSSYHVKEISKMVTGPNGKDIKDITREGSLSSIGGGFNFGMFSSPSVVPTINNDTKGSGLDIQFKVGFTGIAFPNMSMGGFYNEEHLVNNSKNNPSFYKSYGYNYLYKGQNNPDALLDFNREKDGPISKYTSALPIPNYTFDVWTILGQGIGQSVRSHQSNTRFVFDKHTENNLGNGNFYFDFGSSAATSHMGGGGGMFMSFSSSGYWNGESNDKHIKKVSNEDAKFMNKSDKDTYQPYYEPYYYKVNGDISSYKKDLPNTTEGSIEEKMGTYDPMRMQLKSLLNGEESDFYPTGIYKGKKSAHIGEITTSSERVSKSNLFLEVKNNQLVNNTSAIQELNQKYMTNINNYDYINNTDLSSTNSDYKILSRTQNSDGTYKPHHIGGFIATNSDGLRYVYGIPVYNKKHVECTFSVMVDQSNPEGRKELNIDEYNPKEDLRFTNNYYSKTEIPPYPNTYLLTGVIGADYIDVTNNGITDDDLGYWVKFNYYKDSKDFNWRMPFKGANYNLGMPSAGNDDKGSYMYGEREQYYLHSVETKTHLALFHLESREDNLSAQKEEENDDGVQVAKRLESIELYSKAEYAKKIINNYTPIPIKKISFTYDYDLCKGSKLNSTLGNGKLTLKKISFKYKESERSEKNVYEFEYGNNPGYETKNQDCWGTYDAERTFNIMNPYVNQQKPKTDHDNDASAWSLSKIIMPSGSVINIEYEADDYAYVQNKKAMQMTQMCNASGSSDFSTNTKDDGYNYLINTCGIVNNKSVRYLYLKIDNLVSNKQAFIDNYLGKDKFIYFKIRVDLRGDKKDYEYVGGYAEIDLEKMNNSNTTDVISVVGGVTVAKIYLKSVKTKDGTYDGEAHGNFVTRPNYHPLSIAAWNYFQMNRPDLIGAPDVKLPETSDPSKEERRKILLSLLNPFKGLAFAINGIYGGCFKRKYGSNVDLSKSYVRLYSNNERTMNASTSSESKISQFKYGGGLRVRKISISPNKTIANSTNDVDKLGVVYDYTMLLKDENGNIVPDANGKPKLTSSGVATYEPSVGGEENPLRQPVPYEVDIKTKTNYVLFTELPFNESLFPAPSVGYSRVTVRSLVTDNVLKKTTGFEGIPSTGQTVHSFYTSKDYPVISDLTELEKFANDKPINIFTYFYNSTKNYYFGSQGYSIELNDMNGKLRSVESYAINADSKIVNAPISGNYYYYKSETTSEISDEPKLITGINGGEPAFKLNNKVDVIERADGNSKPYEELPDYTLGVDFDIINDIRQSVMNSGGGQIDINVDLALIYPLPTLFPRININMSKVKTAVTNKIIYRSAILQKTVQLVDGGGKIETKNIFFDKFTGQALVQRITNEYGKKIEMTSYPAYWEYASMGPGYRNTGTNFQMNVLAGSIPSNPPATTDGMPDSYIKANPIGKDIIKDLRPGDELLVTDTRTNTKYKGIIMKCGNTLNNNTNISTIWIDVRQGNEAVSIAPGNYECFLYRSGYRNQLNAKIENYSTLN